jgi:hypothetical protein
MKTHSATVGARRRARDLRWRLAACIVALAALCPALAGAQAPYPAKSVRIVVPYAVGGIADTFSRLLAVALAESTGQTVVTDNRPGGNGLVGSDIVAKAAPDGSTLLVSGLNSYWIKSGLGADVPFHPLRDLTPIAFMVSSSWIVVVHPSVQATTLRELVDLAKSQPGALNYGSAGYGTFSQLFESIKHRAGIDATTSRTKGEGESSRRCPRRRHRHLGVDDGVPGRGPGGFAPSPRRDDAGALPTADGGRNAPGAGRVHRPVGPAGFPGRAATQRRSAQSWRRPGTRAPAGLRRDFRRHDAGAIRRVPAPRSRPGSAWPERPPRLSVTAVAVGSVAACAGGSHFPGRAASRPR